MATLISPGTSFEVINDSYYIARAAATVPLFIFATAEQKTQINGSPASGTFEANVIRQITSVPEGLAMYGLPTFYNHGDVRNEYGLFGALHYVRNVGYCYVMRVDVNLDDSRVKVVAIWDSAVEAAAIRLETLVANTISQYNAANDLTPTSVGYKQTVTATELEALITTAMTPVFNLGSFSIGATVDEIKNDFYDDQVPALPLYTDLTLPPVVGSTYKGLGLELQDWVLNTNGSVVGTEWTPDEAGDYLVELGDQFKLTITFWTKTKLGNTDLERREAIVTAIRASITNQESLRDENLEFNIIACPGFPEIGLNLGALTEELDFEVQGIGDVDLFATPASVVEETPVATPTVDGDGPTTLPGYTRFHSQSICYAYPHVLTSNFDGADIVVPNSAIYPTQMGISDKKANVWWAPAGTDGRGLIPNALNVGYLRGIPGTSDVTFVPVALNKPQRDNLYKNFTNINPIHPVPQVGFCFMGQKNSAGAASLMMRINVYRLVAYIRRQIRKASTPFLFRPGDQKSRDDVKALCDNFLNTLLGARALNDFIVICDESNNPPEAQDQNEVYIDIAIKPVTAIEFMYFRMRVVANANELVG